MGFQLFTDQGQLAVSSDYRVMQFVGIFQLSNLGNGKFSSTFACDTVPLVFAGGQEGVFHCLHSLVNNFNGTWTATVHLTTDQGGGGPTSGQVYVFATVNSAASSGYGITVFDQFGVPTFDGSRRVLQIAGSSLTAGFQTSISDGTINVNNRGLDWGVIPPQWAVCAPALGYANWPSSPVSFITGVGVKKSSSTSYFHGPGGLINVIDQDIPFYMEVSASQSLLFIDTTLYQ